MRAVRRTERGIEVVDAPRPRGEGVRVRIRAAGICQTDVNLTALGPLPQILGHELAGETEDGRPVAIEPFDPCGRCADCAAGDYLYCVRGAGMIFGIGPDGGMAEELIVPERAIVSLPAGVRPQDASLVEPLSVNLHSLDLAGLRSGQSVAVIGGNLTGLRPARRCRGRAARLPGRFRERVRAPSRTRAGTRCAQRRDPRHRPALRPCDRRRRLRGLDRPRHRGLPPRRHAACWSPATTPTRASLRPPAWSKS